MLFEKTTIKILGSVMLKMLQAISVVLALCPSVALAQDYDEGMRAYEAGDTSTALQSFTQSAEQGDIRAQFMIGMFLASGTAVPKDLVQASKWFLLAAVQGLPEAQYELGLLYAYGDGVRKDEMEAERWLQMAAEQGYPQQEVIADQTPPPVELTPGEVAAGSDRCTNRNKAVISTLLGLTNVDIISGHNSITTGKQLYGNFDKLGEIIVFDQFGAEIGKIFRMSTFVSEYKAEQWCFATAEAPILNEAPIPNFSSSGECIGNCASAQGICMGNCSAAQGLCISGCLGDGQCIGNCAAALGICSGNCSAAHGVCISSCN